MTTPDIAYFLNAGGLGNQAQEFRYSLRSLANLPHGRVFAIGGAPDWFTGEVIRFPNQGNKWMTLMGKFAALAKLSDVSEVVYAMGDDFVITEAKGLLAPLYTNTLKARADNIFGSRKATSLYGAVFRDTEDALRRLGAARFLNHQVHAPQVIDMAVLRDLAPVLAGSPVPLGTASLVANLSDVTPVTLPYDWKVTSQDDLARWRQSNHGFLSTQDSSFHTSGAAALLRDMFPTPSPYEGDL